MTDNSNGARKMVNDLHLRLFTNSYIESLMGCEMADEDAVLKEHFDAGDLSDETRDKIVEECRVFLEKGAEWITPMNYIGYNYSSLLVWELAGHDFYLTRQHHGCGFWDGDWTEEAGTALTEIAATFPTFYPDFVEGQIVLF